MPDFFWVKPVEDLRRRKMCKELLTLSIGRNNGIVRGVYLLLGEYAGANEGKIN